MKSGGPASLPEWQDAFGALLPGLRVLWWEDAAVVPEAVAYVLVWEPTPGRLAQFPNLRIIFSSAAGVDHIVSDPTLPARVPIVRMASEETAQTVAEFVCLGALALLRDLPRMIAAQAARRWDSFDAARTAPQTRVSILGMGNLGTRAARMLRGLGFQVSGWGRTARIVDGMAVTAGDDELARLMARTDILVGLLPDTPMTRGLICARRIAWLPAGAGLVNAGRGSLVVMDDLLAALDSGQLGGAVLDVFEAEPLPPSAPAWRHPRILATSHVAGFASRRARAAYVAGVIAGFARGERPAHLYQPARGY
ncbi:MAG: glyoxylate/hydroxypyruvate reductase A [Rhodospirillales bacterium]|nr:glyoxylate/hydroxypyruvate reductase A [Rhodospirillales bacterium]